MCESLKNVGGGTRPFLVVASFAICHFNTDPTSEQKNYPPPESIPSLWICTNCYSYEVEYYKTQLCLYLYVIASKRTCLLAWTLYSKLLQVTRPKQCALKQWDCSA